jgi:hypothetical protein
MFRSALRRFSNRRPQPVRRPRSRLLLESLEDRRLMAGNVTITSVTLPPTSEGVLTSPALTANVTDTAGVAANQLTATIDYGDGSPLVTAAVTKSGPTQYTVSDNHTFLEEAGTAADSSFTVTLHVFETASPNTNTDTAINPVQVPDASLAPGNPVNVGTPLQVIGGNNGNSASAATAFATFKTAIGGVDNGGAAPTTPLTTGFRTINWDGVKLDGSDFGGGPNTTVITPGHTVGIPLNRFQERGVFFGAVYAVSGAASATDPSTFTDVNPGVAGLFPSFSPKNTFAMFNDNGIDFKYVLPSSHTTSLVSGASRGFGAIFDNVTIANTTSIEYFHGNTSLGKFFVPPGPKGGTEFLGVLFDSPIVTNVQLILGTDVIFSFNGSKVTSSGVVDDGVSHNLVVVDDFAYPEPVAIANGFPINSGAANTVNAAAAIQATEGAAFTGVAGTFSDANPNAKATDFTAVITWGDGHQSNGLITKNANGGFDVSGTNTYATAGTFAVNVDVQDFGGALLSINNTAQVVTRTLAVSGVPVVVAKGVVATNVQVATFTDSAGPQAVGNYTATIDWGDGTPSSTGTITQNGTTFTVTGSHTFAEPGKFTINVIVSDKGGSSGSAKTSATIGSFAERLVAEIFEELLHRAVDAVGLGYWSGQVAINVPASQVVRGIQDSVEYRAGVVQDLYNRYLHRNADPGGLGTFVNFLGNGGTVAQVAAALVGSGEYFQVRGGGSNGGFLGALYQDALSRGLDPTGQVGFTALLNGGVSPGQVAGAIFGSGEFNQNLVKNWYQTFLHRQADDGGLATFTNALQQGARYEDVIAALLGSGEFQAGV